MIKINTVELEIYFTHYSSFSEAGAHITHNAAAQLSDITGGNFPDYIRFPWEPQRLDSSTPWDLWTHFDV